MPNVPASVRQRLLNLARSQRRPFQELLQFYVMERFLYRMSQSEYADCFILKGALMLQVWRSPQSRPTRDIDLLGRTDNTPEALAEQIRAIVQTDTLDDGLVFDADALQAEAIIEDAEYQGVRVRLRATLAGARARLQLDIGFGDAVVPAPQTMRYPALLDFPAPELLCYSRESAIAEKLQAMVALGELNSRMKDFYDIWLLSRQLEFELPSLRDAIEATFARRQTPLPRQPLFTERFATEKQPQWEAFIQRLNDAGPAAPAFAEVLTTLERFLGPAVDPSAGLSGNMRWSPGEVWQLVETG